jgi:hypothetical protein
VRPRAVLLLLAPVWLGAQIRVEAPSVHFQEDLATATALPWIELNGHQYLRHPGQTFYCEPPPGAAALAAAEAFAYGVKLEIQPAPADVEPLGRMRAFLKRLDQPPLPVMANIGIVDDGSELTAEVTKLVLRRNLLVRLVATPDPALDLNVQLGTPEFPKEKAAADPYLFSALVRQRLGEAKRLVRILGSDIVLVQMRGDGTRARLHLLSLDAAPVKGLRVVVRGAYATAKLAAFEPGAAEVRGWRVRGDTTEFSISEFRLYAVVDLSKE